MSSSGDLTVEHCTSCELTVAPDFQVERVVTIMQNPRQYKIPDWFLNRQKDVKDGKYSQVDDRGRLV